MNGLGAMKNILILGERVWAGMVGVRKLLILLLSDADGICGFSRFRIDGRISMHFLPQDNRPQNDGRFPQSVQTPARIPVSRHCRGPCENEVLKPTGTPLKASWVAAISSRAQTAHKMYYRVSVREVSELGVQRLRKPCVMRGGHRASCVRENVPSYSADPGWTHALEHLSLPHETPRCHVAVFKGL